ncbi:MAG: mannonate dehydratase [Paracoccaceae bacterium]|jgi:mannonate dehydratase
MYWALVESLPVSEDIKKQSGPWRDHTETYKQRLRHLAAAGLKTICYNFMPVLDWTRTDLAWRLPGGATCMRFDWVDFVAFDLFILDRHGSEYAPGLAEKAQRRFSGMDEAACNALSCNIVYGLPGAADNPTLDDVKTLLTKYSTIGKARLRCNLADFLQLVIPEAETLGMRMCCHPDDPPFPLMGLPRIVSTEADYAALTDAVDSHANGITLCTGSLGARPDNDLAGMVKRLGSRVHFLHLRNVEREDGVAPGSFHESGHITGSVDMAGVVAAVLAQEARRKAVGRDDHQIPFRPDHGLDMLDDLKRGAQPGYPLIGRMMGLSEFSSDLSLICRVIPKVGCNDTIHGGLADSFGFPPAPDPRNAWSRPVTTWIARQKMTSDRYKVATKPSEHIGT